MGGYAPRAPENSVRPRRLPGASGRPLNFSVRRPSAVRVLALISALVTAAVSVCAALWLFSVILERTDREAVFGVFLLLCLAAPFGLAALVLSLLNRRMWPRLQVLGSIGAFALFVATGALWAVIY